MLSGLVPSSPTFLLGHYRSPLTTLNGMVHPSLQILIRRINIA
ncbi:hypothetical protein T4D_4279 [Trichinella pseudospiralis]|uniref:Uncharacterized protein n=1 Tax=Trichinella pseudospiralis TaxID=6337 RepID=A0A0V1F1Z5_TRIPS|nr:hypothetical protein T4D_4279 [Trichinella pseudospiralis]